MKITIYLNNGMQFTADVEGYDAADFSNKMNNPQMVTISIGNIVVNKHAVMMVVPSEVVPTT